MTRPRRLPASLALLVALALGLAPRGASAEVLRLKTGETIKGRVVTERSNEAMLVIEDYATGAVREIAWDAIADRDEERWKESLGIEFRGGIDIECDVVTVRVGSTTDEIEGVIESDTPERIVLRTGGRTVEIERARIAGIAKGRCEATNVYTAEELYRRRHEQEPPSDARSWFRLAMYAEQVGAYEEAKQGYENAAADAEFLYAEQARAKAASLAALIRDKEAFAEVRDLKLKLNSNQFGRVREGIDTFAERHPEAGEAVKKAVETLKDQFKKAREKALTRAAGDRFVKIVERLIRARVREKEAKLQDVQKWAKKDLTEEAMGELAKALQKTDPAVTPEEARTLWDGRPKKDWRRARYGGGTFIVEPPKVKPSSSGGKGGGGGGPGVSVELPKPPTRDGWWEKANTDERSHWVLAHYAETSGLFEVHPKKDRTPCDRCVGSGVLRIMLAGGAEAVVLCDRCGGAQHDLTVKFR